MSWMLEVRLLMRDSVSAYVRLFGFDGVADKFDNKTNEIEDRFRG